MPIPPAWTDVRVCPSAGGRLQAVGIDAAGRVQYLYHERFARLRQQRKYDKIVEFAKRLPLLRAQSNLDICGNGLCRERVLAVVIRLINDLYFRVGSEKSVRQYKTYGVTTLRNRHVTTGPDGSLTFRFVGKHHIHQRRVLLDTDLAALVSQVRELKGHRVFQYVDEMGHLRAIGPADVNQYIKHAVGPEYSAKDLRIWGGTLVAATVLAEIGPPGSQTQAKRNIAGAMRRVAERLGNTPAVCRSSYVHPKVIEQYMQGVTIEDVSLSRSRRHRMVHIGYDPEEAALLALLDSEVAAGK